MLFFRQDATRCMGLPAPVEPLPQWLQKCVMGATEIHLSVLLILLGHVLEVFDADATPITKSTPARLQIRLSPPQSANTRINQIFAKKSPPKKHRTRVRNSTRDYIIRCCGQMTCRQAFLKKKKNGKPSIRQPSYKPVSIDGKKYIIPPEKESFPEAKKECEKQGMTIASMGGSKEQKSVSDYLGYIGLSSDTVFSALDALSGAGGIFDGWGKEPDPPVPPGDCTAAFNGAMYNTSCDQKAFFACEEPPYTGPPTPPPGLAGLLPIDEAPVIFAGGKGYVVPADKATVPEATSLCANKGMELMSLESLAETNVVQDFLGDLGLSTSTMLTSLKKLSGGDEFNWLGGVAANVLNWAPNEPKPGGGGGDCAALGSLGLSGITCDSVANFVCEAPGPSSVAETEAPTTTTQDPISKLLSIAEAIPTKLGDSEYLVPKEKANYDDAQKMCGTRDMGLVSLDTLAENDVVQDFLGGMGLSANSLLTSLKKTGVDTFDWFGGLAAETLQWAEDPSAVASGKDCAGLSGLGLSPISCDDLSNFVCESKPATTEPPTTVATLKVGLVNAKINGQFYFMSEEVLTYDAAKAVCDTRGQKMLTIDDQLEHTAIIEGILQAGFADKSFLTSLKKEIVEDDTGVREVFQWETKKELVVDDVEFTAALPTDAALGCSCYNNGAFKFVDCTAPNNFICEDPPATTPAG